MQNMDNDRPLRIGISSCLLGQKVRFDSGHKHDRFLTQTLGPYVEWLPVCPEVEIGLGVPRETIHLAQRPDGVRLVGTKSDADHTETMRSYAKKRADELAKEDLSGYVLKKDSPSCGMERVKIHQPKGSPTKKGVGMFAEALLARLPNLPVEEEGRLCDPRLRENWVERIFAYHALQGLWQRRWRVADLVSFHTHHKFVLMAHCPVTFRELGRLVADAKNIPRGELRQTYEDQFMYALKRIATRKKNTNVLQHMLGFFKKHLDPPARQELSTHIDDYRLGMVPLVVPLTLIRHYVRLMDLPYLKDQVYLTPHPKELALRNHV
jgi:uncharacterized protein YbgA (DUF1722 family)/uncharacterized protein YbbK (DUF523 family)